FRRRGGGGSRFFRLLAAFLARDRLLRVVARRALQEALLVEEAGHAVGRRRALREPRLGLLHVEHDALGALGQQRVVGADLLDEAAVARRARVGDDDAVERALLGARAGHADLQGHAISPFSSVLTADAAENLTS